jgi:outer membrane protein assembly factor BamB
MLFQIQFNSLRSGGKFRADRLFQIFVVAVAASAGVACADWPQFRGPTGDGHSAARNLPLTWGETENIRWKTAIHGRGWSSPVEQGGMIWVTTATEEGHELFVLGIEAVTGRIAHDVGLFRVESPQFVHRFNSHASPTPVLEPGRVYVTFGAAGTACLDASTGEVLWQRRDLECNHFRGAGSSPIIYKHLLLMHFDGSDHQFVVALDKLTGRTVWRRERSIDFHDLGPDGKPEAEGDFRKAFATPHIAMVNDTPLLISQGAKAVYAYDPGTGDEIWRVEERTSHSASSRPAAGHGLIFAATGWSTGQLLALSPGRRGEVLDANEATGSDDRQLQLVWKSRRNVPRKPSLQLHGGLLFGIDDGGIAFCLDARTGDEIWRERVSGNYSASPLCAEERLYFLSEEGKTTVLEAGRQFRVLAENQLDEGFMASPAVYERSLILRTKTHLYRIEK